MFRGFVLKLQHLGGTHAQCIVSHSTRRPTVNYLQYLATGSILTAVGPFQLPAPQSGTVADFILDPTISADCFRRTLKTYLFARY